MVPVPSRPRQFCLDATRYPSGEKADGRMAVVQGVQHLEGCGVQNCQRTKGPGVGTESELLNES